MGLLAVLFGAISAICWGVSDYFGARSAKRFGGFAAGFSVMCVTAAAFVLVYFLFLRPEVSFNVAGIAYAVASGLFFTGANPSFFKALEHGPVNIVGPLSSLYPLITLLFLVLVFGAELSAQQGLGVAIVVAGVLVAAGILDRSGATRKHLGRGPWFALLAACFWGVAFGLIAKSVELVGWQLATLVELVTGVLSYALLLPFMKRRAEPQLYRKILPALRSPWVILAGVLGSTAFLSVTFGIQKVGELAPTVVAVSACYPVLTSFLALWRLKEQLRLVPLAGAFVGVAGVVVLSLG